MNLIIDPNAPNEINQFSMSDILPLEKTYKWQSIGNGEATIPERQASIISYKYTTKFA